MKVWQRHSLFAAPFVIVGVAMRRGLETMRIAYWRMVFGWRIGRKVRVHWSVHIPKRIQVRLADGVEIGKGAEIWSEVPGSVFELGENTNIARNCMFDASGGLTMGANVTVSEEAIIYTHTHGRDPRSAPRFYPLTIGDGVWICARSLILASTRTIGDRAIVGPCEIVRKPVSAGQTLVGRGAPETPAADAKSARP